jgi:hypothetical protein
VDLVHPIREALINVLSQGNWDQIEVDHTRVELAWRPDLKPGWGKPQYVGRVLAEVNDDYVVELARRCLQAFPDRAHPTLQDALWTLEAGGERRLSDLTRRALVDSMDGHRIHPELAPTQFLNKFARASASCSFTYLECALVRHEIDIAYEFQILFGSPRSSPPPIPATHHQLFESFGYLSWPDKRIFNMLEALVYPTTRKGAEQAEWVERLNKVLVADDFELREVERLSGCPIFAVNQRRRRTHRHVKNLIFASNGPKPELGLSDAIHNDIVVLSNAEHSLFYDESVGDEGLSWTTLIAWWARAERLDPESKETRKAFGKRLQASIASPPEQRLFRTYFRIYAPKLETRLPALIPQVYHHYDPDTFRQLGQRGLERRFLNQRMDFLMLPPGGARVVLEVDGKQHYANSIGRDARPSPRVYAETVRGDRELRLDGYDVYRFGGFELTEERADDTTRSFFDALFTRHRLI